MHQSIAASEKGGQKVPEGSTQQGNVADYDYTHEDYEEDGLQVYADRQFSETFLPNDFREQSFSAKVAKALMKE